jgi:hypothetical protein
MGRIITRFGGGNGDLRGAIFDLRPGVAEKETDEEIFVLEERMRKKGELSRENRGI